MEHYGRARGYWKGELDDISEQLEVLICSLIGSGA